MAKILISYRREDAAYQAGGIRDKLAAHFGNENVFMDVDSIPFGHDFRVHLDRSVGACDYLIAVIGRSWLSICDRNGKRRLDNPADFVRLEIEAALRRGIPVIPVLIENMPPPEADQLPESLAELAYRNAIEVRRPPDFNHDVEKLIRNLDVQDKERLRQAAAKQDQEEQQRRPAEQIELDRQREAELQRREAETAELRREEQAAAEAKARKPPAPENVEEPAGRQIVATLAADGPGRAAATSEPTTAAGLNIPSIAMMVCGLLAAAMSIMAVFSPQQFLWDLFSVRPPFVLDVGPIPHNVIPFLPSILFYGFLAYSAFSMRNPNHRAMAFAGGVMAVLPVSPFFILTCPFGIWVLKRLLEPESRPAIVPSVARPTEHQPTEHQRDVSSRALAIGGLVAMAIALLAVFFYLAVNIGFKQYHYDYFNPGLCYLWLNALYYGFVAFAADRMRSRKTYRIAMAGAWMAVLPVSPLFVVTCPLGIWTIRQFKRSDVKSTFASSDRRLAEFRLDGPSRGLIVTGLVSAALASIFAILSVGYLIALESLIDESGGYSTSHGPDFAIFALLVLWVLYYGFVAFAAVRMRSLHGYKITLAGAVLAILPVSPCFVLTCPFGFSTLSRLRKPETKKAFQS